MTITQNVLLSILSEARSKNLPVGKTQLVKYLYLTEVEYYRETGSRLTDLEWKFYYYGPYAFELESIFDSPEFSKKEIPLENGKTFKRFAVAEPSHAYHENIDAKISFVIKRVVGEWGNKSLQELLDYVYFETEPMEAVKKRGEILDFSTIQKEETHAVIPLKASKETIARVAELRKRIAPTLQRFSEQLHRGGRQTQKDKDYNAASVAWDEEMEKVLDVEALKNITLKITGAPDAATQKGN